MSTATTSRRERALCWHGIGLFAGLLSPLLESLVHSGASVTTTGSMRAGMVNLVAGAALGLALGPWLPLPRLLRRKKPVSWSALLAAPILLLLLQPFDSARSRVLGEAGASAASPELVLVTLDTTRADRYWAVAQAMDGGALEAGGARFTQVWAAAGLTAPSHASLFTGRDLSQHGLRNNGGTLRGGPTLARSLLDGGYRTLAATSVIHLDPGFGFGDGFARFAACEGGLRGWLRPARPFLLPKILLRTLGAGRPARPGRETLERARALWFEAEPDRPRFLWVHLFDPHWPYTPEGGPMTDLPWGAAPTPGFDAAEIARLRRLYDGEIRDVRALLAGFLAELRADSAARGRELVVALTSDHGEALGEHGASDHGDLPYDEGLRVPLWVAGPGIPPREVATPYSLTDVGPGLAAWLLGIDPWPTGPLTRRRRPGVARSGAESFAAALRGEAPAAPGEVLIQTDHGAFRNVAVVRDGWKVIGHELVTPETMERKPLPSAGVPAGMPWRGPFELYDLVADPRELDNLYPERLPRSGRFEQDPARQAFGDSLDEIRQRLRELDDWPYRRPEAGVAPEIQDALRELGYLGDD